MDGAASPWAARRAAFCALHAEGCFLLPNPWDAGSARYLARQGFKALATTSSGAAWARGLPDGGMDLDSTLASIEEIVRATDLPVNADFAHGFGDSPAAVAEAVTRCVATGVAGLSIEDATGDAAGPLFALSDSIARLRAARDAIDASGADVMLVGRAECFLTGHPDPLAESLRRIAAYRDAGADILYVPGLSTAAQIEAVVAAAGPCPVNVLVHRPIGLSMAQLASLGVRRVSIGGALAAIAWRAVTEAVGRLRDGDLDALAARMPGSDLDQFFAWRG
ncbi:isocitrate lyase/phosphoenolpyruvate mutase family protein [Roseomonas stagni]|uniref:Isocitrate lyase/phosphoenolpyruvate mutase family protein n=1 Tax=Falsiroseomonas algicola TaxID=2716930 RepID=A0A6M1LGH1_9PROT|nr:isocitrate lyase/phosphoenolpyruvate mutase family protein [Falsiroseomonas algicola]NGM19291.1 isocitrate lyase/phosphoenolpyruvate mutase family protein [Falsiroseomonas algicola]